MNIVLVNPVHPATPHVSGLRAGRFADELAKVGHRVVLVTGSDPATTLDRCGGNDWRRPLVLTCDGVRQMPAGRSRLPKLLRKAGTAWKMASDGGEDGAWIENAVAAVGSLQGYRPDVVWGTFGQLEAVMAAKRIAASAGCPWVLDLKDNWELYVPYGLRRLMAFRTRGWSAVTANSRRTAGMARVWQNTSASILYSGVDNEFFDGGPSGAPMKGRFSVNLVGSVYLQKQLDAFLEGVAAWLRSVSAVKRSGITIRYLGVDVNIVAAACRRCVPDLDIDIVGYLSTARMAAVCRDAAVNAYIAHPGTFHHKLLELLACGRPVLVCPAENDEARALVEEVSGVLLELADSVQVEEELRRQHRLWESGASQAIATSAARRYSWSEQASGLLNVLCSVARLHEKAL